MDECKTSYTCWFDECKTVCNRLTFEAHVTSCAGAAADPEFEQAEEAASAREAKEAEDEERKAEKARQAKETAKAAAQQAKQAKAEQKKANDGHG